MESYQLVEDCDSDCEQEMENDVHLQSLPQIGSFVPVDQYYQYFEGLEGEEKIEMMSIFMDFFKMDEDDTSYIWTTTKCLGEPDPNFDILASFVESWNTYIEENSEIGEMSPDDALGIYKNQNEGTFAKFGFDEEEVVVGPLSDEEKNELLRLMANAGFSTPEF